MDQQEKIVFLREATKAFQMVKRTADALIDHHRTCKVCRSTVAQWFMTCHDVKNLAFDYLTAKVDADEYVLELRNIELEIRSSLGNETSDPKLLEWLEGLHKLEDDRQERGI